MKITLLCMGGLKEKYTSEGFEEYFKRLSRYTKTELIEVKGEEVREEKAVEGALKKEAQNLLKKVGAIR